MFKLLSNHCGVALAEQTAQVMSYGQSIATKTKCYLAKIRLKSTILMDYFNKK
jgi:hypothetical protein